MRGKVVETLRDELTRRIVRRVATNSVSAVQYVRAVSPGQATGLVADVYARVASDFQITAPIVLHSVAPDLLAAVWCVLRETLIAGQVARAKKEAIATGVSQANTCPYCVTVHAMMLHGAGDHDVGEALLAGDRERMADQELGRLAQWAARTLAPDDRLIRAPPFEAHDRVEIVGTVLAFHYVNRMVSVFLGAPPVSGARGPIAHLARRVLGSTLGWQTVTRRVSPGSSLELLPESSLPSDMGWAASNSCIAGAFARAARVTDSIGTELLPVQVREVVSGQIARWRGKRPGVSRAWLEAPLHSISAEQRPVAAFALLVALAPYQVDRSTVESFRARLPSDSDLVRVAGWAAFTAARRVGSWLSPHP